MSEKQNRRIVLAARPQGEPRDEDFRLEAVDVPSPGEDQVLLRTIYLSLDPYMRGRMNAGPSYAPPVEIGQVMEGERSARWLNRDRPISCPETSFSAIRGGRSTRWRQQPPCRNSTRRARRSQRLWA